MKMRPFFLAIGFLFCGSSHGSDGALTLEEIRLPPPVPMDAEARAAGVPAVQVPAIDPNAPLAMESLPPPPVNLLSDEDSELSPRESASVDAARQWMAGSSPLSDLPAPGDGGSVVFRFGAVLPSVGLLVSTVNDKAAELAVPRIFDASFALTFRACTPALKLALSVMSLVVPFQAPPVKSPAATV